MLERLSVTHTKRAVIGLTTTAKMNRRSLN